MLLFTWTGLMNKTADLFQWTFRLMEDPNRNMNILFIALAIIGALGWLWKQNQFNNESEQTGRFK